MAMLTKSIQRKGETLVLTNQRAVFWKTKKALILSDLHIGKSAHFRKNGIAIPSNVLDEDLRRLKMLVDYFEAQSLIVVGDMFHAGFNKEMEVFKEWKNGFENLSIHLVKGNHDRLKKEVYDYLGLFLYKPVMHIPPMTFIHDFKPESTNEFCISGHTHPGVSIKLKGRQRIKLPCYQLSSKQLILPAFSKFTGLNTKACPEDAVCIAFTDSEMFAVN